MVLLVTGAGLGGDAALIERLRQLGADIAPYSRYEDRATGTATITDAVFHALGGTWAGFLDTEDVDQNLRDLAAGELGQRARAIVGSSESSERTVIPDERNGTQLEFWRTVFDDDVSVAHIVASPTQAVTQMVQSGILPFAAASAVWEHQVRAALHGARGLKNVLISLPALQHDAAAKALSDLLGFDGGAIAPTPESEATKSPPDMVAPIADMPPSAAALWAWVQENNAKHAHADEAPPSGVDAALLETAMFAIQRTARAPAANETSDELNRLRFDLEDIKQQLQTEVERSSQFADGRSEAQQELKVLRARNHQLETARSLRIARLLGDPVRRVVRRLK